LGWPGHERQWGRPDDVLEERRAAVDAAYTTPSLEEALAILQQYDVTYIVVGTVERATYSPEGLAKFDGLQQVSNSGLATLYRVPPRNDTMDAGSAGVTP